MRKGVVFGAGYLGRFHGQKLAQLPNIELRGIFDVNQEQCQLVAKELGCEAFSSFDEATHNINYAVVAASTKAHFEIALELVKKRIPVLVEKPICATFSEAETLVQESKRRGVSIAVGHLERFNPVFNELKESIRKAKRVEIYRENPFVPRGADVSVLHDLTIHDLDTLLWIFGKEPKLQFVTGVRQVTQDIDKISVELDFDGVSVGIKSSRIHHQAHRAIWVHGESENLYGDLAARTIQSFRGKPDSKDYGLLKEFSNVDALFEENRSFIESLDQGSSPFCTGEEALKALYWVEKIHGQVI